MQIDLLSVFTDQFDGMKAFYADVLGFQIAQELDQYVEFGGQPVRFAICQRQVMQQVTGHDAYDAPPTGCPFELAFPCKSAAELDACFRRLIDQGAREIKPPSMMPWGHYAGFFADPDGNVHELFARVESAG